MRAIGLVVAGGVLTALFLGIAWCVLLVFCWPLALLALVLLPILCLLALPLFLIGVTAGAALALIRAVLYLPARLLDRARCPCRRAA